MKLNKFNKANMGGTHIGDPTISFSMTGFNSLSKKLVEKIGLKETDRIAILQDDDNPSDWYLLVGDDNGFNIRANDKGGGMAFNNMAIAKSIVDAFELGDIKGVSFMVATDPTEPEGEQVHIEGGGNICHHYRKSIYKTMIINPAGSHAGSRPARVQILLTIPTRVIARN